MQFVKSEFMNQFILEHWYRTHGLFIIAPLGPNKLASHCNKMKADCPIGWATSPIIFELYSITILAN